MSIATAITRLQTLRNSIRTKMIALGMLNDATADLEDCSDALDSVSSQAAQTIYPSTSDQSVASGKYLSGPQTIKGVTYSGLDAGNIKKDVVVKIGDSADDDRIVSVTGTYEGGGTPTPDPYHLKVNGNETVFVFGGDGFSSNKVGITTDAANRRSIWSNYGDTAVYFNYQGRTPFHLIPIPNDATTVTLTINNTGGVAIREYTGSGASISSAVSTNWISITANVGYTHTLTAGANYICFRFRNPSNTSYTAEQEPTTASIDFS